MSFVLLLYVHNSVYIFSLTDGLLKLVPTTVSSDLISALKNEKAVDPYSKGLYPFFFTFLILENIFVYLEKRRQKVARGTKFPELTIFTTLEFNKTKKV